MVSGGKRRAEARGSHPKSGKYRKGTPYTEQVFTEVTNARAKVGYIDCTG